MDTHSQTMVIVGAGQAGGRAALTLRAEGHPGPILLLGSEAQAPYERPPLSKGFLTGERSLASFTFATPEALHEADVEFRAGAEVVAIDRDRRTVRLRDGEEIAYARLLLATGRAPRRLAIPEDVTTSVHVLRDLEDAERLRAMLVPGTRLVIVGGGFIGLEVAASAVGLGAQVTVIELAPRLLARCVPEPIAGFLHERHVRAGVDVRLGRSIVRFAGAGEAVALTLDDGAVVTADAVLVGIGAEPRTALAQAAGLAVDRGILVDATLATSDPLIFAAGDVTAVRNGGASPVRLESWKNAEAQGALAARNMLGAGEALRETPWFWSDQYELTLQIAGWPERGARTVAREVGPEARLLFHLDDAGRIVGVSGVGPASLSRDAKLAQMLLERGAAPDPAALADPATRLKALL